MLLHMAKARHAVKRCAKCSNPDGRAHTRWLCLSWHCIAMSLHAEVYTNATMCLHAR